VPLLTAVNRPFASTVATPLSLVVQTACRVTFCVV